MLSSSLSLFSHMDTGFGFMVTPRNISANLVRTTPGFSYPSGHSSLTQFITERGEPWGKGEMRFPNGDTLLG